MTTSRCPRSRSTRRDPLPHALRFVRHRPWFFRFGVPSANCMASWSFSVGYPSVISSCLPSPLLFVVLVRSGCWCVRRYYESIISISVAIATESGHDLVRGLGRSVEGAASGRGSMVGNRACPSAPSPPPGARYSMAQARTDSKGRLSRRSSDPGCMLATGGASVGV
jgi:hypothetical protein